MCAIASLEIVMLPSGDESMCSASTAVFDHQSAAAVAADTGDLDGLLDLPCLQAARADIRPLGLAVQDDADALQVRVEAALGGDHRVAPVITEARLLPADGADLGHRRGSVAEPLLKPAWPGRGDARRDRPSRARFSQPRRPCPR